MKKVVLLCLLTSFVAAGCNSEAAEEPATQLQVKQQAETYRPPPTVKPTPEPEKSRPVSTKQSSSSCDPNYSGCVPIASDVDCAGGSGNGPGYVRGPIKVIGTDIYGLDRDGDGIACQ